MTWTSETAPYTVPPADGQADAWTQATDGRGGTRLLAAGVVDAPDDVRAALNLGDSEQVVCRVRLVLLDGEPIEQAVSYWPARWAAGTALAELAPVKGGTIRLVAELGWSTASWADDVTAEVADGENIPDAPVGAALLVICRTLVDASGAPFEYDVMHGWDGHGQRYTGEEG